MTICLLRFTHQQWEYIHQSIYIIFSSTSKFMMDIPENKYEMMDTLKGMHIGKHDDFYSTDLLYRILISHPWLHRIQLRRYIYPTTSTHTLQQIAIRYMDPMGFGTCNFLAKSMTRSLSWKILKGNKTQRIFSLWQPTAQFPWGETRVVKPQQKMLWKIIRDSFKNTVSRRCLTVPCPKSSLEPGVLTIWVLLKKVFVVRSF